MCSATDRSLIFYPQFLVRIRQVEALGSLSFYQNSKSKCLCFSQKIVEMSATKDVKNACHLLLFFLLSLQKTERLREFQWICINTFSCTYKYVWACMCLCMFNLNKYTWQWIYSYWSRHLVLFNVQIKYENLFDFIWQGLWDFLKPNHRNIEILKHWASFVYKNVNGFYI